jgi:hypothetical protein
MLAGYTADNVFEMDALSTPSEQPARTHRTQAGVASPLAPAIVIKDYTIGIVLLLVVVVLWTTSNFLTQVKAHIHQAPCLRGLNAKLEFI